MKRRTFGVCIVVVTVVMSACQTASKPAKQPELTGLSTSTSISPTVSTKAGSPTTTESLANLPKPVVPAPPSPFATGGVEPVAAAQALAAAVNSPATSEAAWLSIYEQSGIPVFGNEGQPLGATADDPLGPSWWVVRTAADIVPGRSLWLTDATSALRAVGGPAADPAMLATGAKALVTDIRALAASDKPRSVFTARFIDARLRIAGSPGSVLDPAFNSDTAKIDTATLVYLSWVIIRSGLWVLAAAPSPPTTSRPFTRVVPAGPMPGQVPSAPTCSQQIAPKASDPDQAAFVLNWVINKLGTGVDLGVVQLPSFVEWSIGALTETLEVAGAATAKTAGVAKALTEKLQKYMPWVAIANVALGLAALQQQLKYTKLTGALPELVRAKDGQDGSRVIANLGVSVEPPEGQLDGNDPLVCALNYLGNFAGIGYSPPAKGPLAGADVLIEPGENIPTRVYEPNPKRITADGDGKVSFDLLGRARRKVVEPGKRVDMRYSVNVSAQPEATNGRSIFNLAMDGVAVPASGGMAIPGAMVDVAKTVRWSLGQVGGPLVDWEDPQVYAFEGQLEAATILGAICSLELPFRGTAEAAGYTVPLVFSAPANGVGTFTGKTTIQGVEIAVAGSYTLDLGDNPTIKMTAEFGSAVAPQGSATNTTPNASTFPLVPLDKGCDQ
jgi:hypothetical protein